MKVALVLAPSMPKRSPLIGLAYLASYLRNKGHEVAVLDLNASLSWPHDAEEHVWEKQSFVQRLAEEQAGCIDSLAEQILKTQAAVIGFSVWATTKYMSFALAEKIKQKDKKRLIVFGGPDTSFSEEELIRHEAADVVVCGEGEETFAEAVSLYEKKGDIDFCPGAILKKGGTAISCGPREEIADLDSLPFPDYSDYDLSRYREPHSISMLFYRGCIRRCAFCNTAVTWKRFRSRSAKSIFNEMVCQGRRYPGIYKFEVDDTALNLDLGMVSEVCDLILASGLKIHWGGSALIRREMDEALLKKMARAGCNCIGYGLESGSQKIIDRIGKGFRIEDAQRIIRATHDAGIETILGIIIGFPGETDDDFRQTLEFLERNKEYISWVHSPSECCFGRKSYLSRHPERFDAVLRKGDEGIEWSSLDGTNTHEVRQERLHVFAKFLREKDIRVASYATAGKDEAAAP